MNGTLLFLRKINLSLLLLRKIIGGSYEKIIRFYFLYEILKENIVNLWGKFYLTTSPK